MADLAITSVPIAGGLADVAAAAVAATALGDTAPVGYGRFLYIANGDTDPHTVTLTAPGQVRGLDVEDPAVTVAAGDHALIPLPRLLAGADGRAAIGYDAATSVTVAVLELGS